jgi:hypothetical protein
MVSLLIAVSIRGIHVGVPLRSGHSDRKITTALARAGAVAGAQSLAPLGPLIFLKDTVLTRPFKRFVLI